MLDTSESIEKLTEGLNEPQSDAVTAKPGNYLILAGAGSGKTRVLVHRIAYLIEHYGVSPLEIVAVTFTNKAAREMRGRVIDLIPDHNPESMWIGTFHGIANRILRRHVDQANLKPNFEILSSDDQKKVVKDILRSQNIDPKVLNPAEVCGYINRCKDRGERSFHVKTNNFRERDSLRIYGIYEAYCQEQNLVDFGELLLRCQELWLNNEGLLQQYHSRFTQLLVDEFQDTNAIQFSWIQLLAGASGNVMVVGDDDQSIYGWRGAIVGNIREFPQTFQDTETIRLEENYRSTAHILNAANAVIANNPDRLGKTLWTRADEGKPITVYTAPDEYSESRYVVGALQRWLAESSQRTLNDVAVLYRNNYQSRVMEALLTEEGIHFTVRGGTRFYDRVEIRNALGYMRLATDRSSDVAFDRVINSMPRGIGAASQRVIDDLAASLGMSKWEAVEYGLYKQSGKPFSPKLAGNLRVFVGEINKLSNLCKGKRIDEIAQICIDDSGLRSHVKKQKSELTEGRLENLDELIRACADFQKNMQEDSENAPSDILRAFLDNATLDAGDERDPEEPSVSLLTLHSAKGLEFGLVFIIGMEEGIFPHARSMEHPAQLLEERRLAYVGITRAMVELHLSHARARDGYGIASNGKRSRFIKEIPTEHAEYIGWQPATRTQTVVKTAQTRTQTQRSAIVKPEQRFNEKDPVLHTNFGRGTVLEVSGYGPSERVLIQFEDGSKKLLLAKVGLLSKA